MNKPLSLSVFPEWLEASVADGEAKPLPRFRMLAYSGGAMQVRAWRHPVVIDCAGIDYSPRHPIRMNHDATQGVGHTESVTVENGQLLAEGVISRDTEAAREVVASGMRGFPWQASVGMSVAEHQFVKVGEKVTVNGQDFLGPVNVVRRSVLGEISFVDCPADRNTAASIAAHEVNNTSACADEGAGMNISAEALVALVEAHQADASLIVARAKAGDDEATINQAIAAAARQRDAEILAQAQADAAASKVALAEVQAKLDAMAQERDALTAKLADLAKLKAGASDVGADPAAPSLRRSTMSMLEKARFQHEHGVDAYWKLPD